MCDKMVELGLIYLHFIFGWIQDSPRLFRSKIPGRLLRNLGSRILLKIAEYSILVPAEYRIFGYILLDPAEYRTFSYIRESLGSKIFPRNLRNILDLGSNRI